MSNYIALVVCCIASTANTVFAQIAKPIGINLDDHLLIKISDQNLYGLPEEEIMGSPYLKDEFQSGDVYSIKGKFSDVPMRYNIYRDFFEFQQGNNTYILDPQPLIRKIQVSGKTFVPAYIEHKGSKKMGFLIVLDSGKVTLMVRKSVSFRERQAPKALESTYTPARYSSLPDSFHYKLENGEVIKIESVKRFIEALPNNKEEAEAYAKKEKISSLKEEKLRKLIQYYNGLVY